MSKICGFFIAASAVFFFSTAVRAGENILLALNPSVKPAAAVKSAEIILSTAAQTGAADIGTTDFDAFSAVNDPLYREGSKEFLQQESKQDAVNEAAKTRPGQAVRDAPASKTARPEAAEKIAKPQQAIKKPKAKKPVSADPLNVKNTL